MKLSQTSPIKEIQQKHQCTHSDLSKSSVRRNIALVTKLLCWFKDTADFDESEE